MMADLRSETNLAPADGITSRDTFVPERVNLRRRGGQEKNNEKSSGGGIDSSVIFAESNEEAVSAEDVILFDEIDEACPHIHEGGEIAKEPKSSSSGLDNSFKASFRSYTSNLIQSSKRPTTQESNNPRSQGPTNDLKDFLEHSEFDGASEHSSKRSSIVGGKPISDMTFDEKRALFAPERSRDSLLINNHDYECDKDGPTQGLGGGISSRTSDYWGSVDWSSLTKSCKRAKEAMRDDTSSQAVVKNMFLTHFTALITVLTLYAMRYTDKQRSDNRDKYVSLEELLARTIETKRALMFAMSCLAPSSSESELFDDSAKKMRQDLQVFAVEGKHLPGVGVDSKKEIRDHGLHVSLSELIVSGPISYEHMNGFSGGKKIISSLVKNRLMVQTLAARLLCNLVTDNPAVASTVLFDIPFSPTPAQLEKRMIDQVLESNINSVDVATSCWSDLIQVVSQTQTITHQAGSTIGRDQDYQDREVLAAVVAALHNLLVSMEMRDSIKEVTSEMKRIEKLKQLRKANKSKMIEEEEEQKHCNGGNELDKPIDALFDAASSPALVNALLRSTLPATTILKTLNPVPTIRSDSSRPKFVPPAIESSSVDDTSDSATEWISYVLERMVSRGLFLQVLHSAGGKGGYITPEQVVLVSCIRQAIDAYQFSLPPSSESSKFDMRRLSITTKSTNNKRPHPLWGRGDGLRIAIPVLHSLAIEVEEMRLRTSLLQLSCAKEEYEGELNCTNHIIHDIRDILAQCLGKSAPQSFNDQCILSEARSVLGRDSTLIKSCCEDLARVVDVSLASNFGKSARELNLSPQDQEIAVSTVRLIGNLVYQCQYNQDLLRSTIVLPSADLNGGNTCGEIVSRTGLHVLLSATSLGPACLTLREWCIVAIRNAVENNEANVEMVRRLEASEVLEGRPLRNLAVKFDLDEKGNVRVQKRDP